MDIPSNFTPSGYKVANTDKATIENKLQEAKRLQRENPIEALEIYKVLADEGNSEAQYCCGVMLLEEGHGIKRDFGAAVFYLRVARFEKHIEAKKLLAQINNRYQKLCSIIFELGALTGEDATTQKSMLGNLQQAMLGLIMVDKKGSVQEHLTITYSDMSDMETALKDLLSLIAPEEHRCMEVVKGYQLQISNLLTEGVENHQQLFALLAEVVAKYNDENGTSIGIMLQEFKLPEDLWNHIGLHYMPMSEYFSLANVSKPKGEIYDEKSSRRARLNEQVMFQELQKLSEPQKLQKLRKLQELQKTAKEIFRQQPALRIDKYIPCDQKGIQWLANKHITDHMWIQKIRNGQLTWEEIKVGKSALKALQESLSSEANEILRNQWIRYRIIDKTLPPEHLSNFTKAGTKALFNPAIQSFLEKEENWSLSTILCKYNFQF